VPGGDQVRPDRVALDLEAVGERVLPERAAPARERIAAPERVDQHVEAAALLLLDAGDQGCDLVDLRVIDTDRDAPPAGGVDQRGRLLDRLVPPHRRLLTAGRAAGAVDRGAARAQLERDPAACAAGGAGHERHRSGEVPPHAAEAIRARAGTA
jgi:hypothetical protein